MLNCAIRSMYLCLGEMNRAAAFCGRFFQSPHSAFDVKELFALERVHEPRTFGGSGLPSMPVSDIDVLR